MGDTVDKLVEAGVISAEDVERINARVKLVAVRVDENGYLYAPVPMGDVDPIEVVVSFLSSIDADHLEDVVLREHSEETAGCGFLEALKKMAVDAGS